MSFNRWGYEFDQLYSSPDYLQNAPGVYVVWCEGNDDLLVLDVGQSDNVKGRLLNHERSNCWFSHCLKDAVQYSATYTHNLPEGERIRIEQFIRQQAKPVCSEHLLIG